MKLVMPRLPIRVKLLLLIGALLLASMVIYLLLAVRLISEDRLAYAFDLNQAVAKNLAAQADATLGGLEEQLRLFGRVVMRDAGKKSTGLAEQVLTANPAIVRVSVYLPRAGRLVRSASYASPERLAPLEISEADLRELDKSEQALFKRAVPGSALFVNRSLPPSAQLLSVLIAESEAGASEVAWYVIADVIPDRLLDVFAESSLYAAYLVDAEGVVLAHPDAAKVIERASFAARPAVKQIAMAKSVSGGALAWENEAGAEYLSAWGLVGKRRLGVVSDILRDTALASGRRLARLSLFFGIGILSLAFLGAAFFAKRLTTPIQRLRDATAALAGGRYDVELTTTTQDEIGELARDFAAMARAIKESQAKLVQSEKMAAFGQLGAGITHEVKNPLGGIRALAQLARMGMDDPKAMRENLGLIEKETTRCLEIVQNFLRFARPSSEARSRVAAKDMVEQGLKLVAHQLATSDVKLHVAIDTPVVVMATPEQIQQVLLNLVLNAQQAMPRGGNVWVEARVLSAERMEIVVRDDGPGIPPEILPRIFEPFFTTKGEGQGTGLGLSVSYGIVRDHGGELLVESSVGKGTTFRVRLPLAEAGEAAA